jgi:hypothetical protein
LFMPVFSTLGSLRLPKVEASLVHSETLSQNTKAKTRKIIMDS